MQTGTIEVKNNDLLEAYHRFAGAVVSLEEISAILVPMQLPMKSMVMPMLVSDPEKLTGIDPLAPAFALNAAKLVSRLTRKPAGQKVAVMLRPCEIRAFVELVKLKQGQMDDLIIIGSDCLGAYANKDYFKFVQAVPRESTPKFYQSVLTGQGTALEGVDLAPACKACEYPIPDGADVCIGLFGVDTNRQLLVQAQSEKGAHFIEQLTLDKAQLPEERDSAIDALTAQRMATRDRMAADTTAATNSLEKLTTYLANCINCYNCRVACPVCYCRECVFVTDVFEHEPIQYLSWAKRKGAIKMPTDTVFYHLTRLAHMSTACVGCGQCSNACPNDLPVMELFRTVALRTQAAFDYLAGKNVEDKPPLAEFREDEFQEIVGVD